MSICVDGKHCRCQPDDNKQPDSTRWCPNKIMAEWQKEYEQLRTELEATQKRIAELEGRTCGKCAHNHRCDIQSIFNFGGDEGCCRFEPKD